MKNDIADKVKTITSRETAISESEAAHLLVLIRKSFEHMGIQQAGRYPTLRFYCNWALHIKIDRMEEGWNLIKELNTKINLHKKTKDTDLIVREISSVIGIRKLRDEMSNLFVQMGLSRKFVDAENSWDVFLGLLFEILRDCTVSLPEPGTRGAERLYDELTKSAIREGIFVTEFAIVNVDEGVFEKQQKFSGTMITCLRISTTKKIHIVVPLSKRS